ncbi:hypothetical protein SAMD00019534_082910 [Acytostelium subglobosum LB1]|uniref:hypothetical protein n=1 Tax=Acytostelium subglobosum LB1 TaxID=1410327 RepID=UPI000644B318|nr:hypothetical protein SAMD00019534_082910 [Acytostelium subglobosum LB1]GAM25116.1 hypothetical protein SAMD00019534_082910 [Acytostelium subglobosum LB1]|eukprot:XP_012752205.1 hypothetical protein SAMD00019534_082910 [Acytostelium subglobosum LB1]
MDVGRDKDNDIEQGIKDIGELLKSGRHVGVSRASASLLQKLDDDHSSNINNNINNQRKDIYRIKLNCMLTKSALRQKNIEGAREPMRVANKLLGGLLSVRDFKRDNKILVQELKHLLFITNYEFFRDDPRTKETDKRLLECLIGAESCALSLIQANRSDSNMLLECSERYTDTCLTLVDHHLSMKQYSMAMEYIIKVVNKIGMNMSDIHAALSRMPYCATDKHVVDDQLFDVEQHLDKLDSDHMATLDMVIQSYQLNIKSVNKKKRTLDQEHETPMSPERVTSPVKPSATTSKSTSSTSARAPTTPTRPSTRSSTSTTTTTPGGESLAERKSKLESLRNKKVDKDKKRNLPIEVPSIDQVLLTVSQSPHKRIRRTDNLEFPSKYEYGIDPLTGETIVLDKNTGKLIQSYKDFDPMGSLNPDDLDENGNPRPYATDQFIVDDEYGDGDDDELEPPSPTIISSSSTRHRLKKMKKTHVVDQGPPKRLRKATPSSVGGVFKPIDLDGVEVLSSSTSTTSSSKNRKSLYKIYHKQEVIKRIKEDIDEDEYGQYERVALDFKRYDDKPFDITFNHYNLPDEIGVAVFETLSQASKPFQDVALKALNTSASPLKTLSFSSNSGLTAKGLIELSKAPFIPTLNHLIFQKLNDVARMTVNAVGPLLKRSVSLEHLDIGHNTIGNAAFGTITSLITYSVTDDTFGCQLRKLVFDGIGLEHGFDYDWLPKLLNLDSLHISRNNIGLYVEGLSRSIQSSPNLTYLEMTRCRLPKAGLTFVLSRLPTKLQRVDLAQQYDQYDNTSASDDIDTSLLHINKLSRLPDNLVSVDLRGNQLAHDDGLISALLGCNHTMPLDVKY